MWPRGSSQWKQFTRAFDSCLSKNHKVNCRISYCLCQKKEVHRRRIILCCVFAQWLSMVRRLDPLVWCTAFAWRLNCKTTCLKEYLEWRYCDLTWRGYICNKQESNQVQRPLQCKWWQGDRWWLPDEKSYEFRHRFSPKELKNLRPCRRYFAKLVFFD